MRTSERACIDALRKAAGRLGEPPTKAQYEELGLTPASATIVRVMGGWNTAKETAGLDTNPSTGSRVGPKPDDVELPDGLEWEDLSVDQRWHYRNVEWNTERSLDRRARLRAWANGIKYERGCLRCGVEDAACLDFHHLDGDRKTMAITNMITYGYGKEPLNEEMAKCAVLCANCHRREHCAPPETDHPVDRLRQWVYEHKRSTEGCEQCEETDPSCLDFHHDSDQKGETVANLVSDGRSKDVVRAEFENCTLLCANCHRKEHFEPPGRKR